MKPSLLPLLTCPVAGTPLRIEAFAIRDETDAAGAGVADVEQGALVSDEGRVYPILDGVPRLIEGALHLYPSFRKRWSTRLEGLPSNDGPTPPRPEFDRDVLPTLRRFEKEWSAHDLDGLTWGLEQHVRIEHLLRYVALGPGDLKDKWLLDAGAGTGQLACSYATLGGDVVGADLSPAVARTWPHRARWAGANASRVHLVQADLMHPPFRDGAFDVIHSSGVLHHTPDTRRAFDAVARLAKPGGTLAVWLYKETPDWRLPLVPGVKADALSVSVHALRRFTKRLPPSLLYAALYAYAAGFQGAYRVNEIVRGRKHEQSVRERVTSLYDTLAPPFVWRHAPEEVRQWFREDGYAEVADTSLPGDTAGFNIRGRRTSEATA